MVADERYSRGPTTRVEGRSGGEKGDASGRLHIAMATQRRGKRMM